MNQILNFDNGNNKKKTIRRSSDVRKIIIIFSIVLIVFGIVLIGKVIYNEFYKNSISNEKLSKPTVNLKINDETGMLDVEISHDAAIKNIVYNWNEETNQEIDGRNRNYLTESIEMPTGTNKFKITVTDVKDVTVSYEKEYTVEKAKIDLSQGNGGVNVSVNSKADISFITYKWNDENEEKIEVNSKEYQSVIKVPSGENTLTIVATDVNGIETKIQKQIQGIIDEKPTLNISIDDNNFIIKATDDEKIEKVAIRVNGNDTVIDVNDKEFEYKIPFREGYNEIKIKVFNLNGLTVTKKAAITK